MKTPASQIGAHAIQREIGRGGMGVVYLARDSRLDRQVAIKALPEQLANDPDRLTRFEREAKVVASLNHPGIAAVYALEEHDGQKYLVMEYVEGETLATKLQHGRLPVDESIGIAIHIAEAIEAAHEKGVIHRDLKPRTGDALASDPAAAVRTDPLRGRAHFHPEGHHGGSAALRNPRCRRGLTRGRRLANDK
jgi:serine/threonine protein kinase